MSLRNIWGIYMEGYPYQGRIRIKKPLRRIKRPLRNSIQKNPKGPWNSLKKPLFRHFVWENLEAPATSIALLLWPDRPWSLWTLDLHLIRIFSALMTPHTIFKKISYPILLCFRYYWISSNIVGNCKIDTKCFHLTSTDVVYSKKKKPKEWLQSKVNWIKFYCIFNFTLAVITPHKQIAI
jgi:hypothetical protein